RPKLKKEIELERESLLKRIHRWLEVPMLVLAFVWLALFVAEIIWGLNPLLEISGYIIWGLFVFEFAVSITLAPRKLHYFRQNWLKVISLLAPALRVFRIFAILRVARLSRLARMSRGLRLLRLVSSINRGMQALASTMRRRGFGYILTLTFIVILVGAAGMYSFELEAPDGGFDNYGEALWWTAMILTTLGSEYWPQTASGRILCFFLSLYSFGVFGYITATLATFFVGRDAEENPTPASANSISALQSEIVELREEVRNQGGGGKSEP
ncbi:MAG TPA: ion transporter, partial [Balneolaceae bacterium]|nr:ion transporter [Balneolaceae bacterium]